MRSCRGTARRGGPCGAHPLTAAGAAKRGLPEEDQDYCAAHHPLLSGSARFGSLAQAREAGKLGGRPRMPRPSDVARELVEQHVAAVLRPYFKALGLELHDDGTVTTLERGAILTGEAKDGTIVASDIEDLAAQMAAAEKLLDRIYGRPKQATEISGPAGGPVELVPVARDEKRATEVADLMARTGVGRPLQLVGGANGNGNGNGHANGNGNGNGHANGNGNGHNGNGAGHG